MQVADRLSSVRPSASFAVNTKAAELREQGRKIVSLAIGGPDFPAPAHICAAAKKAVDEGFTRYTAVPGIPELRRAVGTYY